MNKTNHEQQIKFIQKQYLECKLGTKIPPLLEVHPTSNSLIDKVKGTTVQGKYPADVINFDASVFIQRIKEGPLHACASDIMIKICNYQFQRQERFFLSSGSLGDPTHLLLEEMKEWIASNLSSSSFEHLDIEIYQRIQYLERIEQSGLFPSGSSDTHLNSTLIEVKQSLEVIHTKVKNTLDSQSAEQELKHLLEHLENFIQQSVYYLYFIFHDEQKISSNYTFDNFRRPYDDTMKMKLKTYSGQLLAQLLKTSPFLEIFPENLFFSLLSTEEQVIQGFEHSLDNPFIEYDINLFFNQDSSTGLYDPFLNHKEAIQSFVEVHGLLLEIAYFMVICQELKELASIGGDILIYGIANDSVKFFILTCSHLIQALNERVKIINLYGKDEYKKLKQKGKEKGWALHYIKANNFYKKMNHYQTQAMDYIAKINSKAEKGLNAARWQQIKEKFARVTSSANEFSQRWASLFNETKDVAVIKKDMFLKKEGLSNQPSRLALTSPLHPSSSTSLFTEPLNVKEHSKIHQQDSQYNFASLLEQHSPKKETQNAIQPLSPVSQKNLLLDFREEKRTHWQIGHIAVFAKQLHGFDWEEVERACDIFAKEPNHFTEKASLFCCEVVIWLKMTEREVQSTALISKKKKAFIQEECDFVKYLCMKACQLRYDLCLLDFIKDLKDELDKQLLFGFSSTLKKNIYSLLEKVRKGQIQIFLCLQQEEVLQEKLIEINALKQENSQLQVKLTEISTLKQEKVQLQENISLLVKKLEDSEDKQHHKVEKIMTEHAQQIVSYQIMIKDLQVQHENGLNANTLKHQEELTANTLKHQEELETMSLKHQNEMKEKHTLEEAKHTQEKTEASNQINMYKTMLNQQLKMHTEMMDSIRKGNIPAAFTQDQSIPPEIVPEQTSLAHTPVYASSSLNRSQTTFSIEERVLQRSLSNSCCTLF